MFLLQSALVVERQVIGWFTVEHPDPECCTPSGKFPVFLLQDEDDYWYGFPQFGHNGLKVGKFHRGGNLVDHPSQLDRTVHPQDEQVGPSPQCYTTLTCNRNNDCLNSAVNAPSKDWHRDADWNRVHKGILMTPCALQAT